METGGFKEIRTPKRSRVGYIDVPGVIQYLESTGFYKCDVITKDGVEKLLARDTKQRDIVDGYLLFHGSVLNLVDGSWRMMRQVEGTETQFNRLMLNSLSPEIFRKGMWEKTGYDLKEVNGRVVDGIYLSGEPEYVQVVLHPIPFVDPRQKKREWNTMEYYLQGYVELERRAFELVKTDLDEKNFGDAVRKLTKAGYASTEVKEGDEITCSFHGSVWTTTAVLEHAGFGEGQQKQNYIKIHKEKTNERLEKGLLDWSWKRDRLLKKLPFRLVNRYFSRNPRKGHEKRKLDDPNYLRDLLSRCEEDESQYKMRKEKGIRIFSVLSTELVDNALVNTQVGSLIMNQEVVNDVWPEFKILNLGKVATKLLEKYSVDLYQKPDFFQVEIK